MPLEVAKPREQAQAKMTPTTAAMKTHKHRPGFPFRPRPSSSSFVLSTTFPSPTTQPPKDIDPPLVARSNSTSKYTDSSPYVAKSTSNQSSSSLIPSSPSSPIKIKPTVNHQTFQKVHTGNPSDRVSPASDIDIDIDIDLHARKAGGEEDADLDEILISTKQRPSLASLVSEGDISCLGERVGSAFERRMKRRVPGLRSGLSKRLEEGDGLNGRPELSTEAENLDTSQITLTLPNHYLQPHQPRNGMNLVARRFKSRLDLTQQAPSELVKDQQSKSSGSSSAPNYRSSSSSSGDDNQDHDQDQELSTCPSFSAGPPSGPDDLPSSSPSPSHSFLPQLSKESYQLSAPKLEIPSILPITKPFPLTPCPYPSIQPVPKPYNPLYPHPLTAYAAPSINPNSYLQAGYQKILLKLMESDSKSVVGEILYEKGVMAPALMLEPGTEEGGCGIPEKFAVKFGNWLRDGMRGGNPVLSDLPIGFGGISPFHSHSLSNSRERSRGIGIGIGIGHGHLQSSDYGNVEFDDGGVRLDGSNPTPPRFQGQARSPAQARSFGEDVIFSNPDSAFSHSGHPSMLLRSRNSNADGHAHVRHSYSTSDLHHDRHTQSHRRETYAQTQPQIQYQPQSRIERARLELDLSGERYTQSRHSRIGSSSLQAYRVGKGEIESDTNRFRYGFGSYHSQRPQDDDRRYRQEGFEIQRSISVKEEVLSPTSAHGRADLSILYPRPFGYSAQDFATQHARSDRNPNNGSGDYHLPSREANDATTDLGGSTGYGFSPLATPPSEHRVIGSQVETEFQITPSFHYTPFNPFGYRSPPTPPPTELITPTYPDFPSATSTISQTPLYDGRPFVAAAAVSTPNTRGLSAVKEDVGDCRHSNCYGEGEGNVRTLYRGNGKSFHQEFGFGNGSGSEVCLPIGSEREKSSPPKNAIKRMRSALSINVSRFGQPFDTILSPQAFEVRSSDRDRYPTDPSMDLSISATTFTTGDETLQRPGPYLAYASSSLDASGRQCRPTEETRTSGDQDTKDNGRRAGAMMNHKPSYSSLSTSASSSSRFSHFTTATTSTVTNNTASSASSSSTSIIITSPTTEGHQNDRGDLDLLIGKSIWRQH